MANDSFGETGQTAIGVFMDDDEPRILRGDMVTHTLAIIDYAHHEIHEGDSFMYTDAVTLASTDTQDYMIVTPNTTKWAHMLFFMDGSAITQFELYEGGDRDGTTDVAAGNMNRNSDTVPTTTIYKGTSGGTTDGTLIHIYKGGASSQQSKSASSARGNGEIILKQNTKYILRITSGSNSNLCNVQLVWYEHTSKT